MRVLERNKKVLWFANRLSESYVVDTNGFKTGEKEQTYGTPQRMRASMSISSGANNLGSQGMVALDPYGLTTAYTHNAVTEDMNCPLDEEALVWYGREPTKVVDSVTVPVPYNFKVVRKAQSLNHLIYYLREVDAS